MAKDLRSMRNDLRRGVILAVGAVVAVGAVCLLKCTPAGADASDRTAAAITHYERALRLDKPGYAVAHYHWGRVLEGEGRTREAIALYQQALKINPALTEAHNSLGNSLLASGRPQEAMVHYGEALRLSPEYAEVRYNMGRAADAIGGPGAAIEHYKRALKANPEFLQAHYNLGNAMVTMGRAEDAIHHYKQALVINPHHVGASNNLVVAKQMAEERDEGGDLKPEGGEGSSSQHPAPNNHPPSRGSYGETRRPAEKRE